MLAIADHVADLRHAQRPLMSAFETHHPLGRRRGLAARRDDPARQLQRWLVSDERHQAEMLTDGRVADLVRHGARLRLRRELERVDDRRRGALITRIVDGPARLDTDSRPAAADITGAAAFALRLAIVVHRPMLPGQPGRALKAARRRLGHERLAALCAPTKLTGACAVELDRLVEIGCDAHMGRGLWLRWLIDRMTATDADWAPGTVAGDFDAWIDTLPGGRWGNGLHAGQRDGDVRMLRSMCMNICRWGIDENGSHDVSAADVAQACRVGIKLGMSDELLRLA